MSVQVVDTLKPKNNGNFPVAEAADIAVSSSQRLPEALAAKADVTALAETNAVVDTKASITSVTETAAGLQNEIDQIVISASAEAVVAPEVAAARVDEAGVSHTTLKERIDSDANNAASGIKYATIDTGLILPGQSDTVTPDTVENVVYKNDGTTVEISGYSTSFYNVKGGDVFELVVTSTYTSNNFVQVALIDKNDNWKYIVVSQNTTDKFLRLFINNNYKSLVLSGYKCRKIKQISQIKPAFKNYGAYNRKITSNQSWVYGSPVGVDGFITGITLRNAYTGNFFLYLCEIVDGAMTVIDGYLSVMSDSTNVVFDAPIRVYRNQHLGFYATSSIMGFSDDETHNSNYAYYKRQQMSRGGTFDQSTLKIDFDWIVEIEKIRNIADVDSDIADVNTEINSMYTNTFRGKKYITHGDSITWYDGHTYPDESKCVGYQTIMDRQIHFAEINNQGWSGRAMADDTRAGDGIVTRILSIDHSDYDLCTIAAGTNDFGLDVPLGEKGTIGDLSFDRSTFYGAYRVAIEYILAQNPTIRLCLFTPLQRDYNDRDVNYVNAAGCKLSDYANAVKELGEMYSIPVCDMYANSSLTELTLSTYTIDGLHPNNAGFERMGNYAAKYVNSLGV